MYHRNSSNDLLEDQKLHNQVANCIYGYNKLLLSYSGGLDSTVLLDILTNLIKNSDLLIKTNYPIFLRAVYIDHGFSINSINWSTHCKRQCKIRNIPFHIIRINCINSYQHPFRNFESIARSLRYQELCNFLNPEEILLTAHHMDDHVETVLLSLKRGSGPAGLSGIHKNILLRNSHRVLRPLLQFSRNQLKKYAYRKKLHWIEDHTNTNINFDRNFFRIQIIPLLKKKWPAFNIVVNRTAQLCKNQEELLKELLLESLNKLVDSDGSLLYFLMLHYSLIKIHALLRLWLSNFFIYMPSYQLLNRIWQEVALSKSDAQPILRLGQYICRRFHKKLYILPIDMESRINSTSLYWNFLDNTILLPYKLGLLISQKLIINVDEYFSNKQIELFNNSICLLNIFWKYFQTSGEILTNCLVRPPENYEKVSIHFGHVSGLLHIFNRNRGRKLKKIWQELLIAPWLRSRVPLLFYNNTLIAAIGVFITKDGKMKNTVKSTKNKQFTVCKIQWVQNAMYHNFFKNSINYFLK